MNLILIKISRDSTHANRHTTELFETYILTPLFETKNNFSAFNNHYYHYIHAIWLLPVELRNTLGQFVVRLLP